MLITQLPSLLLRYGTLKAYVAYWGPSEARTTSPQGEREADISGTLDVTEMGNWSTGCSQHKV